MKYEELLEKAPAHLREAGVPESLIRTIAGDLRETPTLATVRTWLAGAQKVLVLCGRNGNGKSLACAWAIASSWMKYKVFLHEPGDLPDDYRFRSALFVEAAELASRTVGHDAQQFDDPQKPILSRARRSSILVIDEAGREDGNASRAIGGILAHRIDGHPQLRTLITSNLLEKEFRERYKGRIMSRILGAGRIEEFGGADLRLGSQQEMR